MRSLVVACAYICYIVGMKMLDISLPVTILKENDTFVAYSPALDISTSAKTFEKVRERFDEVVGIFFEETISRGTLPEALSNLGWEKSSVGWKPPILVSQGSTSFQVALRA